MAERYQIVVEAAAEVVTTAQKLQALRELAESRACEGVDEHGNVAPFSANAQEIWSNEIFDILEGRLP